MATFSSPSEFSGGNHSGRDAEVGRLEEANRILEDSTKGVGSKTSPLPSHQEDGEAPRKEEALREQKGGVALEEEVDEEEEGLVEKEKEKEKEKGKGKGKEKENEDEDLRKEASEGLESYKKDLKSGLEIESCRAERSNRNALLLLSVLLVLAMPVVVWRSIDQPLLIVWRLSVLLCCCCCIWSRLLDAAMSMQTMLFFISYSFTLALYADSGLDPKMGLFIAHLSSHFAAGMLGYALATNRQRSGKEVSAAIAAASNPSNEEADRLLYFQTLGGLYFAVFTLGFAACIALLVWHRADYPEEQLLVIVFLLLSCAIMFWIIFVAAMLLQGALMDETGLCLLIMYSGSLMLLYIMVSLLLGYIVGMIFILHGFLGLSGFFGYSLSVYDSFKLRLKLGHVQLKSD